MTLALHAQDNPLLSLTLHAQDNTRVCNIRVNKADELANPALRVLHSQAEKLHRWGGTRLDQHLLGSPLHVHDRDSARLVNAILQMTHAARRPVSAAFHSLEPGEFVGVPGLT